jgi:hypothetical protein
VGNVYIKPTARELVKDLIRGEDGLYRLILNGNTRGKIEAFSYYPWSVLPYTDSGDYFPDLDATYYIILPYYDGDLQYIELSTQTDLPFYYQSQLRPHAGF